MKKKIGILLFSAILLCSGCRRNDDGPIQNDFNEPSASPEIIENIPVAAGNQAPYWAQGTQIKGNLYQGLNLDGVGEADDEVYVSIYRFGDEYHSTWATVLQVHLGTGETMAKLFPAVRDYDFKTGKICSEDKDAIILGTSERDSNYNASNFWVLNVYPAKYFDEYSGAEIGVALDTAAQPNGMSMDILMGNGSSMGLKTRDGATRMTGAPEVVDIEGSPLQGLNVTVFRPRENGGPWEEWENVICWKDGIWDDGNRAYRGKWEFLGNWTPASE